MFRAAPRKAQLFALRRRRRVRLHRPPPRVGRQAHDGHRLHARPRAPTRGAAIIGNGDPYKIYGYEAMKLILDGLNTAGASKAALLGYLQTGVQNRASVLGTYSLDANGDTTLRTLRPLRRQQEARSSGRARSPAASSSAMPSSVTLPDSVRSASTSRHSPGGQLQRRPARRAAARPRRRRRRARTRRRPGRPRAARRRPRTPRAARPAAPARARSGRASAAGRRARRGARPSRPARRLSGSTSERQSSSSPW